MAPLPPRSFDFNDDPDDLDDALTHTRDALRGFGPTQVMAPAFDKLIDQLDALRPVRRGLERVVSGLEKQKKPLDDELNAILDIVRDLLEPRIKKTKDHEPEEWAVRVYAECFGNEKPPDARKYTLGPQVEIQRHWETKLAKAPLPELIQAGKDNTPIIDRADKLAAAITAAEAALDQLLTGPWADFIASCNAAFQLAFGQLGDLAHAPPAGVKIPSGFVDRYFLREATPRPMAILELKRAIERTKARLTKRETTLEEKVAKQKNDKRAKLLKEAADAQGLVSDANKQAAEAAARLAELQAALAKLEDTDPEKPNG